jgi:cell division protein FtsL|tara:strand:+ start:3138 stop:3392 length:255 start_codon:yes stop_codon:yes gene_type:complete
MKFFFILSLLFFITSSITLKLLIISQENQIKILNQKLSKQNEEIEKLETDLAYISSPQKLKELNELEFQLKPILQENIIIFKEN